MRTPARLSRESLRTSRIAIIKLPASAVSYLQVAPLLLVLLAFFGIPLLMIVGVSFFEFDGISSVPAFQFGNYTELFTSQEHADAVPEDRRVRADRLGDHAGDRLHRVVFPGVPRAQHALADGAVSAVHRAVLDLEHHPHDLVDSVPRAQRHLQSGAHGHRPHAGAAGVSAVLRFRGDHRLRASVHAVHDRADLQLHGAHRPLDRRGGARRRQQRLAHHLGDHRSVVHAPASRWARSSSSRW